MGEREALREVALAGGALSCGRHRAATDGRRRGARPSSSGKRGPGLAWPQLVAFVK